jgi:hypothetical protein
MSKRNSQEYKHTYMNEFSMEYDLHKNSMDFIQLGSSNTIAVVFLEIAGNRQEGDRGGQMRICDRIIREYAAAVLDIIWKVTPWSFPVGPFASNWGTLAMRYSFNNVP